MKRIPAGLLLRIGYVLIILLATFGAPRPAEPYILRERAERALSINITTSDAIDAVRNVLLFAGWGLVWVFSRARGAAVRRLVVEATVTGVVLSGMVELGQLFSPVRTPSVLDVATNTAGAALGAFATGVLAARLTARRRGPEVLGVPASFFALGYGGAALAEALAPLFRQQRLDAWGPPLERLRFALAQVDPVLAHVGALDFLLFVPAGAFLVLALMEAGVRSRLRVALVALGGGAIMAGAEIARGLVGYSIAYGPALAHGLGLVTGAAAAGLLLPRLVARARALPGLLPIPSALVFVAYALILALWMWRPFVPAMSWAEITNSLDPIGLIPLASYRDRTDLFTVADAALSFLLYLPVGALLAARPLRRDGIGSGLWPGLLLVLGIELGQVLVPARWPDVTDVLIQSAGLAVGAALVRRAGLARAWVRVAAQ